MSQNIEREKENLSSERRVLLRNKNQGPNK